MQIEELPKRIKDKDQKAMSFLYDQYAPVLYGIIFRVLKSESESEEILQLTFLNAWDTIDAYNQKQCSLFTWISSIARKLSYARCENTAETDHALLPADLASVSYVKINVRPVLECVYFRGYTIRQASILLHLPVHIVRENLKSAFQDIRVQLKSDKKNFTPL